MLLRHCRCRRRWQWWCCCSPAGASYASPGWRAQRGCCRRWRLWICRAGVAKGRGDDDVCVLAGLVLWVGACGKGVVLAGASCRQGAKCCSVQVPRLAAAVVRGGAQLMHMHQLGAAMTSLEQPSSRIQAGIIAAKGLGPAGCAPHAKRAGCSGHCLSCASGPARCQSSLWPPAAGSSAWSKTADPLAKLLPCRAVLHRRLGRCVHPRLLAGCWRSRGRARWLLLCLSQKWRCWRAQLCQQR